MKFIDGMWEIRKGVNLHKGRSVYRYETKEESISFIVPTNAVYGKGDTMNSPVLRVTISSPMNNVVSVKISHHEGVIDHGPNFELAKSDEKNVKTQDEKDRVIYSSGKLSVEVKKEGAWSMKFFYDGKYLTGSEEQGVAYVVNKDGTKHIREMLKISPGEYIYGLGERFTAYLKNGQTVNMWNEDGGTCSEIAYKNVPFFVSNRKYGVLVNYCGIVSYEVGTEIVSKTQFTVPEEKMEYFLIAGDSIKDVMKTYTDLSGKPALPPAWSFGLWLSTSFTTDYDEHVVSSFIDGMSKRNIPLNVFHFDCFWMDAYTWCGMEFDKKTFPNPKEILKRIKDKGIKICLWINPYIAQFTQMFEEGKENGYFIKKTNGDVWQWDMWQPGMAVVDFTNEEARKWYASKLEHLMDLGVDTFKTDFGERIPYKDVVYHNKADIVRMHNYYTHLYNKTVFETIEKRLGKNKALVFARSGTVGGQKFPVHWGGDSTATYESMAETLRGGLSLALSGYSFWSHDISGFETTATPDLYKRWVAFGLFSSHSRLHGSKSYRVPWNFDDESSEVLKFFTNLKCKLMPYIYGEAVYSHKTGVPMMRPMVMEFEDDRNCDTLDLQYMFGESILTAPIFNSENIARYYIPKGKWTNIITGVCYESANGMWIEEKHNYKSMPLLAKENSIIAMGLNTETTEYNYKDKIEYHIYEIGDGKTVIKNIYDENGNVYTKVKVERKANVILLETEVSDFDFSVIARINGTEYKSHIKKGEKKTEIKI